MNEQELTEKLTSNPWLVAYENFMLGGAPRGRAYHDRERAAREAVSLLEDVSGHYANVVVCKHEIGIVHSCVPHTLIIDGKAIVAFATARLFVDSFAAAAVAYAKHNKEAK